MNELQRTHSLPSTSPFIIYEISEITLAICIMANKIILIEKKLEEKYRRSQEKS